MKNKSIYVIFKEGRNNIQDVYYLVTNEGTQLCYLSPNYTWEKTIKYVKSKGHTLATKEKALEVLEKFNASIEETNEENYTEWCDWIKEQKEEGYNIVGNYFDNYECTGELQEYKRINGKLVTEKELIGEYNVNTLFHEWRHDLPSYIRMRKAEKALEKWYRKGGE